MGENNKDQSLNQCNRNKKSTRIIGETSSWFSEKITKIEKCLHKPQESEKTPKLIRLETKRETLRKILWNSGGHYGLFENLCYDEFENLEETDTFSDVSSTKTEPGGYKQMGL